MIAGVTDRRIPRRDGKIRSGRRDESGKLFNDPHFLLHDAPQLIPVLGENPKEIFCVFFGDDPEEVAPADLRYYTKSELVCQSTHKVPVGVDKPATNIAAFYALGDSENVTARPHPWMPKSRERVCKYKSCPDYIKENCSEHMFINMIIPQYSMGSMFTLETTSIFALLDVYGAMQKVADKNLVKGGKISGEIFRLFKYQKDMPFLNTKTGQKGKAPKWCVGAAYVPYEEYINKFRDKLKQEDVDCLDALRKRPIYGVGMGSLEAEAETLELSGGPSLAQLSPPAGKTDEEFIRERADDPLVIPLFDELASLIGRTASKEARFNTAKAFPDVGSLLNFLKKTIADEKKKKVTASAVTNASSATTEPNAAPAVTTPPPGAASQPGAAAAAAGVNLLGG